jgi:hypothetical protein
MDGAEQLSPPDDDARRRVEVTESILLALTLCGAALSHESIRFAQGIADVMIWSAKHAIRRAVHSGDLEDGPEWNCPSCGELVPENFGICWNCEAVRPDNLRTPDAGTTSGSN